MRRELLSYPAYSPNLAPLDFHPFWKLKTFLARQKFVCNKEATQVVIDYFKDFKENHFGKGIGNL